jgi:hypothetical protein
MMQSPRMSRHRRWSWLLLAVSIVFPTFALAADDEPAWLGQG